MRFLTSHWDLKLVALVMAVALWTYTSGQVRSDRTLDVDLRSDQIGGLGENYQITTISPGQFRVTISVPSNRWSMMPTNDQLTPRLEVRQEALPLRTQDFAVSSAMLGLPSDIRIVRTEPENLRTITVRWDRIIATDLPALRPQLVNLPPGLEAEVQLAVDHVTVKATEDVLEHERGSHVRFKAIDLSGEDTKASENRIFPVQLTAVDGLPYTVVSPPSATVQLRPVPAGRVMPPLPVRVLLPPGENHAQFSVQPARIAVTVHGPQNLVRELHPEEVLTLFVDLNQPVAPGGLQEEVPVLVMGPPWLTWDPVTVHLTITPERKEALPAPPAPKPAPPVSLVPEPAKPAGTGSPAVVEGPPAPAPVPAPASPATPSPTSAVPEAPTPMPAPVSAVPAPAPVPAPTPAPAHGAGVP